MNRSSTTNQGTTAFKNDFALSVSTPKNAWLSPGHISRALKHLIQVGQLLCKHTIEDTSVNADIEADSLTLAIGVPKLIESKLIRIAIFVHGGNVQDVYANVHDVDVTLVDHDSGAGDEAAREQNERIVESVNEEFPFNCF